VCTLSLKTWWPEELSQSSEFYKSKPAVPATERQEPFFGSAGRRKTDPHIHARPETTPPGCERHSFIACISDVVASEIRQAPENAQEAILKRMALTNPVLLPIPAEADVLAQRFIDEGTRVVWMTRVTLRVPWSMNWKFW
jgi:hypothetical protein